MGRYTDNAPVGNTCPMIDEVIRIIESPIWDLDNEDELDLSNRFKEAIALMEKIRLANESLREWGNDMCKDAEEYKKESDEYQSRLEDTEKELKDSHQEIEHLEEEMSMLEDKLENQII